MADELASGNGILMERDGLRVTVTLPEEVTMEVEVEIEHDEREFEVTLSW
ncbi:amphi-Trp domain-containing protein [Microcella sp.]